MYEKEDDKYSIEKIAAKCSNGWLIVSESG